MDRLWTPWRYSYISGADSASEKPDEGVRAARRGVPKGLEDWPGEDRECVFCNLIQSVEWAIAQGGEPAAVEKMGRVLLRLASCFLCLNAFPYASGHVLIVPYRHTDSLAKLPAAEAEELIRTAQRVESALRTVYRPDGINLGMNLGESAGAGVANHLHLHVLPRWSGDTNFMTVTAETRVLPELLEVTWERLHEALGSSPQR